MRETLSTGKDKFGKDKEVKVLRISPLENGISAGYIALPPVQFGSNL